MVRSSHRRCSVKKVFLQIFLHISQENTCVGVSFNKLTGLKACNFIKKRLQHRCFSVKFAKFLRRILKKNYFDEYRQATASILFAFILSHSYNSSYDFIKINFLNCRSSCPEEFSKKTDFIKKETLAQVFSCEFCEIFKNTFFL